MWAAFGSCCLAGTLGCSLLINCHELGRILLDSLRKIALGRRKLILALT